MPPSPKSPTASLEPEIDSLQRAIRWLDGAFSAAEALDERLKIAAALAQSSAQLARLLHVQALLLAGRGSELDDAIRQVLEELSQQWDVASRSATRAAPLAPRPDDG